MSILSVFSKKFYSTSSKRPNVITCARLNSYLLCGFAEVGGSRYGDQGRPVLQEHFALAHVTPDPERCQVHCKVVLLGLKKTCNLLMDF